MGRLTVQLLREDREPAVSNPSSLDTEEDQLKDCCLAGCDILWAGNLEEPSLYIIKINAQMKESLPPTA